MCLACDVLPVLAYDRKKRAKSSPFTKARKVEGQYARQLRQVARAIAQLTKGVYVPEDPASASLLAQLLDRYAETLKPWATAVGVRMVAEVEARERAQWNEVSRAIGKGLRREIEEAPVGGVVRQRMADQVDLITSIPRDAAQRVHKLTTEGLYQGRRASEIAKEIQATGEVSESRAMLIARTEVSRTAVELTRARALHVGSTEFIWRTAGDSDVRPSHRALNGKRFRWDDPPECDPGYHALPGGIFNCRCFCEPVIDD